MRVGGYWSTAATAGIAYRNCNSNNNNSWSNSTTNWGFRAAACNPETGKARAIGIICPGLFKDASLSDQIIPGCLSDNHIKDGPTYDDLISLSSLMEGYASCMAGKRSRRKYLAFALNAPLELLELHQALKARTYTPKPCNKFTIFCNSGHKTRIISEPACIDNVLHHTIYLHVYWLFDRTFIHDSYGCRKGKGTLKASHRCQEFMRQSPPDSYYLQLDLRKFYYSLDHCILKRSIEHTVSDPEIVSLMMLMVDPDSPGKGLNVGAMLSQLYGLIYLNRLDHYVKRVLKIKRYIRYVDDMVFIGLTRQECLELKLHLEQYIKTEFALEFSKAIIQPVKHGINFVGYHTWAHRRKVRSYCLRSFSRALKHHKVRPLQSYLAHSKGTCNHSAMLSSIAAAFPYSQLSLFGGKHRHDLLKSKACNARKARHS